MHQRRLGGPKAAPLEQGDCWATAIIGYAGLDERARNELHRRMILSDLALIRHNRDPQKTGAWWSVTQRFLRGHGRNLIGVVDHRGVRADLVYIASGPSPRIAGASHSILAYGDGSLFSDPHPEGNGLPEINEWIAWFEPTDAVDD